MSADEGFCLPAWGAYTHATNRLHGDALIIAYTIRDPRAASMHDTLRYTATPAYGSPTGAALPVMQSYMSTQREVFEGQTMAPFGRGVRGSSPGNFQKPVLQIVQSELFIPELYVSIQLAYIVMQFA